MKTIILLSIAWLALIHHWQVTPCVSHNMDLVSVDVDDPVLTPVFEGILEMQGIGGAATYYIKGDRVRSEMTDEGEVAIFLYSFNGNSYTALMPSEKIYMEAPVLQLDHSDKDLKEMNDSDRKVTRTGEKRTIHGVVCDKWITSSGIDDTEVWMTSELGFEWGQLFHPMMRTAYSGSMAQYGELKGLFPMKMIHSDKKGRPEVLVEVVRLEKKPLSDDLFIVPNGYNKMAR